MKKEEFLKSIFGLKHRNGYDIIDEEDEEIVEGFEEIEEQNNNFFVADGENYLYFYNDNNGEVSIFTPDTVDREDLKMYLISLLKEDSQMAIEDEWLEIVGAERCNNGDIIFSDGGFEIEGFESIYSKYSEHCGSGYNRFYIAKDSDIFEDGTILIYSNKDGWTGTWGDDVGLIFSQFFGCNGFGDENEFTKVNEYFDIDEEKYFSFDFTALSAHKIEDEPCLCATITMHDSYIDNLTSYVLNLDNEKIYKITYNPQNEEEKAEEVEICFNALYVGCAEGKLYIVNTEDVEGLDLNEILSLIQDNKIEYETTDFGFIQNEEGKTIVDAEYENGVLALPIEEDKEICCLEEDII